MVMEVNNPSNLPLQNLPNAWEARHDIKVTQETIKNILKDGIPAWYKWPKDYKQFARESYLADKEVSEKMTVRYRMEDQESLLNEVARRVNPMSTRDFIQRLRDAGVKCYTIELGYPPQTVGLWAFKPGTDRVIPVCYCQIPAQVEWSVLRLDKRGLPAGESFRGWRTVLSQLILKGIVSEEKAHEIFGRPVDGPVSRRYRQTMFWFRNRRELTDDFTLTDQE
jgi:hypothetical protein